MLISDSRLNLAMPTFFRKILVDLPPFDAHPLDLVDRLWSEGRCPDLRMLLDRVAEGDPEHIIPDLLMADMEFRWKSGRPELFRDLRDYEELLRKPLPQKDRARVLCREFGIRNRWGDCISRRDICSRHPELTDLFIKYVQEEIQDIAEWPQICLLQRGAPIASAPLDRIVIVGRQTTPVQKPWSIASFDFCHHMILCEMQNPVLSREQLEIRLLPGWAVSICNTSQSRAIAVRTSRVVIDAGQTHECNMEKPVRIHLTGEYDIMIRR